MKIWNKSLIFLFFLLAGISFPNFSYATIYLYPDPLTGSDSPFQLAPVTLSFSSDDEGGDERECYQVFFQNTLQDTFNSGKLDFVSFPIEWELYDENFEIIYVYINIFDKDPATSCADSVLSVNNYQTGFVNNDTWGSTFIYSLRNYSPSSGGSGGTTTTNYILASSTTDGTANFGMGIMLVIIGIMMSGMIWNSVSNNKKSWQ